MPGETILRGVWTIRSAGELQELIDSVDRDTRDAFLAMVRHIASSEKGTACLLPNRNHSINDEPKIWQLSIANNLYRAPYFYQPGKIVVVTHIFQKSGRDTPPSEITRALRIREVYLQEAGRG